MYCHTSDIDGLNLLTIGHSRSYADQVILCGSISIGVTVCKYVDINFKIAFRPKFYTNI